MAQAILNRAVSGNWTKTLFGPNNGQIFSNVVTQPRKHNRDVASLEGPRQPGQHSPAVTSMAGTSEKSMRTVLIPEGPDSTNRRFGGGYGPR
jgi:hypothetical protein